MVVGSRSLTLAEFLSLPETQPASEFVHRQILQKPMPQGEHSVLQGALCTQVNQVAKAAKIAFAFSELRCIFGDSVVVPDVAVFRWQRIPRTESGRVANRFELPPDWAIDILSPDQNHTKVLEKLLFCVAHGTELGWLVDARDENVLAVFPEQRVQVFRGQKRLPVLPEIMLQLSVEDVFSWLAL